jgi:hypothetical protein
VKPAGISGIKRENIGKTELVSMQKTIRIEISESGV